MPIPAKSGTAELTAAQLNSLIFNHLRRPRDTVQGGTPQKESIVDVVERFSPDIVDTGNPYDLQSSQQAIEAVFKLVALVLPAVQSIVNPHLEVTGLNSHALQVIEERMGAHNITSLRGGGGPVKFDAQEVGMELDGAIGLLFTQLKALPTVGLSGKVILH